MNKFIMAHWVSISVVLLLLVSALWVNRRQPRYFVNFLKRYARLLILWVALVMAGRVDDIVFFFGHVFYVTELVVSCLVSALLARHLFFRRSIDAYSMEPPEGDSHFIQEWKALEGQERVKWAIITFLVLYSGACWIAASVAK